MSNWVTILIAVLSGGVGIKLVEIFALPKVKQEDIATQIREELRKDIVEYREEVTKLRDEVDEWKMKYFTLIELLIRNNVDIPDSIFADYKNHLE